MIARANMNTLIDALVRAKGRELVEQVSADEPREILASVSYALGFQHALELALLDDELATEIIENLHEEQEASCPGTHEEWGNTALTFINLASKLPDDGQG